MWDLKNTKIIKYNKKRSNLTDIENKLVVTSGERKGGEGRIGGRGLKGRSY